MTEITAPEIFPDDATIAFPGPVGRIEVATALPDANVARAGTALICHPHPLHGGTMQNKVVTTAERALRELGLATVRFNFRGVGSSEGTYDEGHGETDDAIALAQWIAKVRPNDVLWLCGFSFGSFVALNAAQKLPVAQLISIAPPVERYDFTHLPPPACPWLVVMGDADDVVEPAAVFAWVETLDPKPTLERMVDAGHFFHGRLIELREAIKRGVGANLPARVAP
jgi:alpha/beta superfamily hydrolase